MEKKALTLPYYAARKKLNSRPHSHLRSQVGIIQKSE